MLPSRIGREDGHRLRCSESLRATLFDRPTLIRTRPGRVWSENRGVVAEGKAQRPQGLTSEQKGIDVALAVVLGLRLTHEVPENHLRPRF